MLTVGLAGPAEKLDVRRSRPCLAGGHVPERRPGGYRLAWLRMLLDLAENRCSITASGVVETFRGDADDRGQARDGGVFAAYGPQAT